MIVGVCACGRMGYEFDLGLGRGCHTGWKGSTLLS